MYIKNVVIVVLVVVAVVGIVDFFFILGFIFVHAISFPPLRSWPIHPSLALMT